MRVVVLLWDTGANGERGGFADFLSLCLGIFFYFTAHTGDFIIIFYFFIFIFKSVYFI